LNLSGKLVTLIGGTGFVGSRLAPALARGQARVRLASRHSPVESHFEHVACDLGSGKGLEVALEGSDAVYFLAHSMAEGPGFGEREQVAAKNFARAARRTGVARVVYLGGLYPDDRRLSAHLESRRQVGMALIESVGALAVRAGIVVGAGSASFEILADLSRRLPIMIAPRWLASRCQPIGIADAVEALVGAFGVDGAREVDLVGPEVLSYRRMLEVTAAELTGREPLMVAVPVLSPELSALWLRFVTRANMEVARSLVGSLRHDLVAARPLLTDDLGLHPAAFREVVRAAVAEQRAGNRH
jgi:uncharacterized protein YbjT (DUF2867 family)